MNNYREIVTKAVVSKGKKLFSSTWNDYIVSAKAFVEENRLCE